MDQPAVVARDLKKTYRDVPAVKAINFTVPARTCFGFLGPNGAGKTTTVEILEGLRPRTGGNVTVLGFDPDRQKQVLKDRIGVCLQATNLPDKIKVHEALELFAAFYSKRVDGDALLKRLQLWEKRDAFYTTLSGGQKQRLALALALINNPQIIFLDEPTTGLDPQVRLEIRDLIEELRAEKRTILLTTHYIEEAERLCDRVAIIDNGVIIASGSPAELQANSANQSAVEISLGEALPSDHLPEFPGAIRTLVSDDRRKITVNSKRPAKTLVELIRWVDGQGIELEDVHLKRPTLEDVFIELTGKQLRE